MLGYNEIALQVDYKENGYIFFDKLYPYGSFLCMIGNLDVKEVKKNLQTNIQRFVDINKNKKIYEISYKELETFNDKLYRKLYEITQHNLLSIIICDEIYNRIKSLSYISDVNTILFPNYIYLDELQKICTNVIRKNYDALDYYDLNLLSGDSIKLWIRYNTLNEPEIHYRIMQIGDLVAFDASYYVKSSMNIKQCENCNKYFIPSSRSDEIYCDYVYDVNTGRTCKEIGYEQKIKKDLFKSAYRTAYKTQRARIKYNSHIRDYEEKHFRPWDIAAKEALSRFQSENDIKGFQEWLKKNKDNF